MGGYVYQLNVKPERHIECGLPKKAIDSAIFTFLGVEGDFNRWRHERRHDDPNFALVLLPLETINDLVSEGWPVEAGHLGENITTRDIPYGNFSSGNKYRVGKAEIEITDPCTPCKTLYFLPYVGQKRGPEFLRTLAHKDGETLFNRRGWYAKVLKEGLVRKDDTIERFL